MRFLFRNVVYDHELASIDIDVHSQNLQPICICKPLLLPCVRSVAFSKTKKDSSGCRGDVCGLLLRQTKSETNDFLDGVPLYENELGNAALLKHLKKGNKGWRGAEFRTDGEQGNDVLPKAPRKG